MEDSNSRPSPNTLKSHLFIFFVGICFLFTFSTTSWSLTWPHDASNFISCNNCHGAQGSSENIEERTAEEQESMCRSCHNSAGPVNSREGLYQVALHTVESGGETIVIRCGACHDPHGSSAIEDPHSGQTTKNLSLIRTNTADYVSQALSPAIFQSDQEPEGTNTYVFNTTPFSGICQSCHQNTDYWQNSGALPETLHNYGSQCTSCHTHNSGFQPGGCGDCHQQAPLSELPRFANAMHHIMASTDDANCLACHNVSGHAALDVTLNDPADVPTEIYESCNNCHHDASPLMADGHAGRACTQCHDFDIGTAPIGGAGGSGCGTANSCHGTSKSHPTHMLTASEGGLLGIDCEECHNVLSIPQFADGQDLLSSTTVCDNCHSSAGAYDGTVLAKANFETGVYESGRTALKSGSEYWCASCHDDAPARSRREDHTPLIVDNSDVEASRTGNWVNKTTSPGYIGDDYEQSSGGTGTDLFTWQPALPRTAEYKVYAWWINDNFSTSDASFTINYDGGSENIFKNQTGWTVGRWNLLGAFPFVAGSSGSVLLDAINASSSYRVMADAIKWDDPGVLAPGIDMDVNRDRRLSLDEAKYMMTFSEIPTGNFRRGSDRPVFPFGAPVTDFMPAHNLTIDAFKMGSTELTTAQYAMYLNSALKRGKIVVNTGDGGSERVYRLVPSYTIEGAPGTTYAGKLLAVLSPVTALSHRMSPYAPMLISEHPLNQSWINFNPKYKHFTAAPGFEDWPAAFIKYWGAAAFAEYYDLSLPTEAEWEYVARGNAQYDYPTSNGNMDCDQANYACYNAANVLGYMGTDTPDKYIGFRTPVGSYPPNNYGVYDLAGNVWEWTLDWYRTDFYQHIVENGIVRNPLNAEGEEPPMDGSAIGGPGQVFSHDARVCKGGSYQYHGEVTYSFYRFPVYSFIGNDHFGARMVIRPSSTTFNGKY